MIFTAILICLFICLLIWFIIVDSVYKKTVYYKQTGKSIFTFISDKGAYGEYLTYKQLKRYEKTGARFLFNCYLPAQDKKTSEIDVMMLHTSGIYVFESKNYSGWIFGSEDGKTWTQTLPSGREAHKEHFYNPIMQNRTHIKWLKHQIGENYPIYSIIVFSERCELKSITIHSSDIPVINRDILYPTVHSISKENENKISDSQIDELYQKLVQYVNVSSDVKKQHIQDIEDARDPAKTPYKSSVSSNDPSSATCPKCGSPLILKQAKKGKYAGQSFLGCSNYPKCKYIKPLTEK